jgi:hypothetical protein
MQYVSQPAPIYRGFTSLNGGFVMKNGVSFLLGFLAIGLCCGLHLLALGGAGVLAGLLTGKALLLALSAGVILIGAYGYARWRKRSCVLKPSMDERVKK